ncbi:hypothetical protein [Chitinophaga pinensis]|uniref:Beta-lactamase family protein n=1 Tax=Chitinophaga pinensis TaxID=79329 RepID=A0A5C6LNJ3_9BACT|nr:hypothetical protein [Chitinophaga pinensis]TWV91116.1 hypothetical protein FEF09_29040 [Chitinophaga pinensis]
MVLDHTTGFPNWRWFDPIDTSLHRRSKRDITSKRIRVLWLFRRRISLSGESNSTHTRSSLKNLDSLFQVQIAAPLGMEHAWFSWNDFLKTHKVSGHKGGKVS